MSCALFILLQVSVVSLVNGMDHAAFQYITLFNVKHSTRQSIDV